MMKQIENVIFKTLCKAPSNFKPLRRAIITPIVRSVAVYAVYIAVCFALSRYIKRIINKS